MTVAQYASNPVGRPTFNSSGQFIDVKLSGGSTFTSLSIQDCNLGGGNTLYWWNSQAGGNGAWQPVSSPSGLNYTAGPPACVTTTLTSSSSPNLTQLTGTVFGVATSVTVTRLAGNDRIATAVAVSSHTFPAAGSAKGVVLATDMAYPDALAGGPLAAHVGGPLLLTGNSSLDPATQAEIQRVLPSGATVYLVGGDQALSTAIDASLASLGYRTVRVAGADRFATAVAVANALGNSATVFEASGIAFPDAVSAGPAAIANGGAILLTNGAVQSSATSAYLAAHPVSARYAVGGPAASADPSAQAIAGADRYATSALVAAKFFSSPRAVGVATGMDFPDALAAGPDMAANGGPVLLVQPTAPLPAAVASYFGSVSSSVVSAFVYGGPAAVGNDVAAAVQAAV